MAEYRLVSRTAPNGTWKALSGVEGHSLEAAFWAVRARRIDIEIDDFDAALRLGVAGTGVPGSIPELDVAYLRQPEATPLAIWRQSRPALPAKLIGQRRLLALRAAENDRAELAT